MFLCLDFSDGPNGHEMKNVKGPNLWNNISKYPNIVIFKRPWNEIWHEIIVGLGQFDISKNLLKYLEGSNLTSNIYWRGPVNSVHVFKINFYV